MPRILLFLFLTMTLGNAMAQDRIRQVYDQYEQAKEQKKAALANQLCQTLKEKEEIDTLYIFEYNDKTMNFLVRKAMASHYLAHNKPDSALAFCMRAVSVYESGLCDDEYADCLNNISVVCQRTGRFYEALTAQKKCYEYDIKSGNPENMSSSTNNLASLYLATSQYDAAKQFILKSIEIEQALNREDKLAIRYGIASEIYLNLDKPDEALRYAEKAYQLDKKGGRVEKMAIRMSQMGSVYIKTNRLAEAKEAIEKALPLLQQHKNINSQAICHNQLGNIFLLQSDDAQAEKQFREAISLTKQTGNTLLERNAQKGLAQALRKTNPTEALHCMERYAQLSDSIYKGETASQLNQFHSIYLTHELKDKYNKLNEKNASQRRHLLFVSILSTIIVLLLAMLSIILYHLLHARNHANSLLRRIEEMRLDFFSKITHEFRTPLTIINGLSEQIVLGNTQSAQETRHAAEMIFRNGKQLYQLTNQLLDISKLRASVNKPSWRKGDIVAYTKLIVETFSQLAYLKAITLQYQHLSEGKSNIDFVPDFYNKILYNLLSNSLKFTPSGGNVSVSTTIKEDKLILTVADTGIGIPSKDLPHIFEEYYIGHVTDSSISTGVGLALVKQICDTIHGNIQVDSEVGKGTTFTLTLPATSPEGDATPLFEIRLNNPPRPIFPSSDEEKGNNEEGNAEKPKILIVEDNEDVSHFIALMAHNDYQIIYAGNGADGLQKARETIPDLIVSDLMMPKMSGIELCEEIRKDEMLSHIPFIIITANPDENERMKGLNSGADSYLLKPFNVEELNIRIHRLIEQRENMRKRFSTAIEKGTDEKREMNLPKGDADFLQKLDICIFQQMSAGNTDVETIASQLCVSSKQLRRKIYALTNMTSVAYILHVRLSKAKILLKADPQTPISEISLKCGFEDSGYFTKVFKQHYGLTPSAYRKEGKTAI